MAIIFSTDKCPVTLAQIATSLELGSVTVTGSPKDILEAHRRLGEQVSQALAAQGPRAFDNPRSSAIYHEAGHVVVYAHFGMPVRRCKISRVKRGPVHGQWIGFTSGGHKWRSDRTTPPDDDFRQACCEIAGVFAEMMFDPANFRQASSIDEVAVAEGLASIISHKLGHDYGQVYTRIALATIDILQQNRDVVRALAAELDRHGIVRQRQLTVLLTAICPNLSRYEPTALRKITA